MNERNVAVKINGSLASINQENGTELVQLAESLGTVYKIDTYMYPGSREREKSFDQQSRMNPYEAAHARVELLKEKYTREEFQKAAEQMINASQNPSGDEDDTHIQCRAGRSSFVINWQGNMRPCIMVSAPSVRCLKKDSQMHGKRLYRKQSKLGQVPNARRVICEAFVRLVQPALFWKQVLMMEFRNICVSIRKRHWRYFEKRFDS